MAEARSGMGWWVAVLAWGCRESSVAPQTFSDPLVGIMVTFDGEEEVLAEQLRRMEEELYRELEVESSDVVKRSLLPPALANEDVDHLSPRPDRDVAQALAMALAYASPHDMERHAALPLLPDQRPLEPSSPDHYDREFLEGEACWGERTCLWLKTFQDLTKVYTLGIIPPITYEFYKDFRWVDVSTEGEPRWVIAARSWNPGEYGSENGKNIIHQSYTVELWFPRDGRGYVEDPPPEGDRGDSAGGGTLRLLSLWTETTLASDPSETTELGTIRWGMDGNMKAHDKWLADHP